MAGKFVDVTLRLIDKMTSPLNAAGAKLKDSAKQWERAGKQIQSVGKSIEKVGTGMTKAVTLPVLGAGAAAVKTAADFEKGMSGVQAICGATGEELTKLSEKAKEMGAKTKYSATEATDAFKYMAMAGWDSSQMLNGIEGIMHLAGATEEDLASTSDIVTDAITAFGLSAKDTNMFVDVLAQTANRSNTDVGMLGESFKYVAPVAGAMKYSVQDVATALGLMANNGVKASTAGTSLRSWISRMAAPTDAVADAMKAVGISLADADGKTKDFMTILKDTRKGFSQLTEAQKAQYASALAGKNGMSGLLAIVNSSDKDFADLASAIYDSDGACQQMYDTAQNNLTGQLTILKSTVESIAISFGDRLIPYVKQGTEWVQKLADKFNALSPAQQDMIIKIALMAAAAGPAILMFGKTVTIVGKTASMVGKAGKAFKTFGTVAAMVGSPVGITIGVLLALTAAGVLLYKNWDKVKATAGKVFGYVKGVFQTCGTSGEGMRKKIEPIAGRFKEIGAEVKELWSVVSPYVKKIGSVIGTVFKVEIGAAIGAAIGFLGSMLASVTGIIDGILDVFKGLIKFVAGAFTGDWKKAWDGIKDIFGGTFKALVSLAKIPMNGVIGIINGAIAGINKLGITVPDWVPVIGGKDFHINIPVIPQLAKGTMNWKGGPVQVHERGGEIIDLPRGTRVYPHDKSVQMAYKAGSSGKWSFNLEKLADQIVIREEGDIKKIMNQLAEMLEKASTNVGGSVDGDIPVLE